MFFFLKRCRLLAAGSRKNQTNCDNFFNFSFNIYIDTEAYRHLKEFTTFIANSPSLWRKTKLEQLNKYVTKLIIIFTRYIQQYLQLSTGNFKCDSHYLSKHKNNKSVLVFARFVSKIQFEENEMFLKLSICTKYKFFQF